MINDMSYRKAFIAALILHFGLILFLLQDSSSNERPVLVADNQNMPGQMLPIEQAEQPKQQEIVKAVSVDSQEVMETINRLKQEKLQQQKAEQARQQALTKQAEDARKERLREQQRLAKLKDEAAKLAIQRKKQIEEEQKRLKQLALQKEQEAKRLEELKRKQQQLEKQQQEAAKQAELKKKQDELKAKEALQLAEKQAAEKAAADKLAAEKAAADKAAAEAKAAQQKLAAQQQAAQEAAQQARLAGEVDKYKAMIVNAIGRQWILPENVDSHLSSQFRIRLAPDGAVLEVTLMRSSGDPILDRSAQTAIYKASPLPVPSDPETFNLFRDISLTVRPENVRG
ncbi:TolA colicin import membrane protein [Legionella quinlivanii]|uniref:TolA colicin import membrane protein n=1 Tax=Legionella quinlivanii TaxID=45073 RepID=A0A0W0Y431_9GAMM|nr:cell envelope integrity protein TolA [Legionella quinlivanii]KTD51673.1 TolA colicin import membrane protein [Legionella quinlivanii]SEF62641.1 Cell division and transport-associated protein TolA (TC 2.C.1.2.1) [Legionella quinlivanii DSM 21216]STY10800.1 TolA colicin import membrane protein [Legionella quinlivanii]